MIVRMWHGIVEASKADEYAEFMKERAAPDYSSVQGLNKLIFLRSVEADVAHFLLVTHWDSMEAVKKFAGERPEKAKYYPEDDDFLLEKEETTALYEVFYESKDAEHLYGLRLSRKKLLPQIGEYKSEPVFRLSLWLS